MRLQRKLIELYIYLYTYTYSHKIIQKWGSDRWFPQSTSSIISYFLEKVSLKSRKSQETENWSDSMTHINAQKKMHFSSLSLPWPGRHKKPGAQKPQEGSRSFHLKSASLPKTGNKRDMILYAWKWAVQAGHSRWLQGVLIRAAKPAC